MVFFGIGKYQNSSIYVASLCSLVVESKGRLSGVRRLLSLNFCQIQMELK